MKITKVKRFYGYQREIWFFFY